MGVTLETIDCGSNPQTSYTLTPPANTWQISVVTTDLGLSGTDNTRIQCGSEATGHSNLRLTATADVIDSNGNSVTVAQNSTAPHFAMTMWGLTQAMPTVFESSELNTSLSAPRYIFGIQSTASALSDFRIFTNGGATMNAGTIYVTYFTSNGIDVDSVDFGAAAAASHDFSGLNNKEHAIMCSANLGFASADRPAIRTLTDAGATDYWGANFNASADAEAEQDALLIPVNTGTSYPFAAVLAGLDLQMPTLLTTGVDLVGSAPRAFGGYRKGNNKHNAMRFLSYGGNNANAGQVHFMAVK